MFFPFSGSLERAEGISISTGGCREVSGLLFVGSLFCMLEPIAETNNLP